MEVSSSPEPRNSQPSSFGLVALVFFFSGAASLIYEVVWTRQLTTFFGSSLYGVTSVVTSFMGGLALGSFLAGKRADSVRQPLFVYGLIEFAIGLCALAFPFLLKGTQPIIGGFYTTAGDGNFYLYSLLRFVIVFILLIIPTTLMGATLPLLSRAVTSTFAQVGSRIGSLYAINTAGAVAGVFVAGFYMIENFGVLRTTLAAVLLNCVIGGVACIVGRNAGKQEITRSVNEPRDAGDGAIRLPAGVLRVVAITYFVSGFAALAYQVCWTRALIFGFDALKSTTYSFSGMLVVFLVGLALGSAILQRIVNRQENLLRLYALLQAGIGITAGLSFFVILAPLAPFNELNPDSSLNYWNAVVNVMYKTALAIGLPTLLMGMTFPVVTKLLVRSLRGIGSDVGRIYAINTCGAIAGSFAAGFILIPLLGITKTIAALAAVNLLQGAVLLFINNDIPRRSRTMIAVGCLAAAAIIPARIALSGARLQRIQANEKIVHYEEGAMATISVVENNSGDRMIYVDDVGVAGTDKIMLTDQKSLAHVPMALLGGRATNTLSVGFGSGGASYSYTLYPSIQHIHTIEIAPEVLRAAPTLTDSNHGVIVPDKMLENAAAAGATSIRGFSHGIADYTFTPLKGFKTFDPRFKVLLDDARSYLRFTKMQYDVIATDCTDLRYKSNANLYDLEYFTLCRKAISDRGLVVVWMPLGGLSDKAFRVALRTFQTVFPNMSVWYFTNQPTHYCLLIGSKGKFEIDYDAIKEAVEMPRISNDLEEIGLRDPDKLISSFVCGEKTLTDYLKDFPLNTEDMPIIEFESPRYGYDSRPLHDNQDNLYKIQTPAGELLTGVSAGEDPTDRIWKLQEANYVVFEGHSAYRLYDFKQAGKLYERALQMVPWDDSIRRLLDFDELRRQYETTKSHPSFNTIVNAQGLVENFAMQNRDSEAVTIAEEILPAAQERYEEELKSARTRRSLFSLTYTLAEIYTRNGDAQKALQYRQAALKLAGSDDEKTMVEKLGG